MITKVSLKWKKLQAMIASLFVEVNWTTKEQFNDILKDKLGKFKVKLKIHCYTSDKH